MPVSYTPLDVHVGTGYLWYGVLTPGAAARMIVDVNGNPVGGAPLFMGLSQGAAQFELGYTTDEIKADQFTGPIDAVITGESAFLEATLLESSLQKVLKGFGPGVYASGTDGALPATLQAYEEIAAGGILALPQASIALISPRRGPIAGKFVVCTLYAAVAKQAFQVGITKSKESVWKVRWDGLSVTTRAAGDQLGKIYRQT